MSFITKGMYKLSGGIFPLWTTAMPKRRIKIEVTTSVGSGVFTESRLFSKLLESDDGNK
jgi:hypothetical protein